jgi:hypothetical protein
MGPNSIGQPKRLIKNLYTYKTHNNAPMHYHLYCFLSLMHEDLVIIATVQSIAKCKCEDTQPEQKISVELPSKEVGA